MPPPPNISSPVNPVQNASLDSFDSNQAVVKLQSLYTGSSENMNVWSYGNIINTFSGSAIYTNHLSTSMDYGGTDNHYGQNRAFATGSGTTAKSSSVDVASNFTDVFCILFKISYSFLIRAIILLIAASVS